MMYKKTITCLCLLTIILVFPLICSAETHLTWGQSDGVVDGYRIFFSTTSGNYTSQNSKDVGIPDGLRYPISTLMEEMQLQCGVDYYFVVRAYNQYGESDNSAEVRLTPAELMLRKPDGIISINNQ